tara:strand:+ start:267 stop:854 length:588 start_codon:yes stop_codon:yes gene_type:complete
MYELPSLPYAPDALAPHISERTISFHYGKHHQGYVDKLNAAVEDSDLEDKSLEDIIHAAKERSDQGLFNNAAQVWNHNFFWNSMSPDETSPSDALSAALDDAFGGVAGFNDAFKAAATGQFGSGWAWLVAGKNGLEVKSTSDADLPLAHGERALICCDVWEHAYYLDYQNARPDFVDVFLDKLINWDFASKNLEG